METLLSPARASPEQSRTAKIDKTGTTDPNGAFTPNPLTLRPPDTGQPSTPAFPSEYRSGHLPTCQYFTFFYHKPSFLQQESQKKTFCIATQKQP
jgi:hypothetical protein